MRKRKSSLDLYTGICLFAAAVLLLWNFTYKKPSPGLWNPEDLKIVNPDYYGILEIHELLREPVVKCFDNSYYLSRNFRKEPDKNGCLFADSEHQEGDQNLTIYGHNNYNHERFSDLTRYKGKTFAESHPNIVFTDRSGQTHNYRILLVFNFNTEDLPLHNPYLTRLPEDFVSRFSSYPVYYQNLERLQTEGVHIMTLSTCEESIYGRNGRLIITALETPL